jgi:phosphatidylethanolamine/phosphatidyl-N-methylethanolamine N-methyltransferase
LKNTSQFYNRISFIYPLIDWFLKPQKELLAKEINGLKKGKLLEVGVGNGKHLNLFQKHEITGIDISEKMLKTAQSNQREKVNLLKMNAIEMTFPNSSFDYVILSHIVSVVENPTKLIAESCRVLKPNGKIFILNHFTPTNWLRFIDILKLGVLDITNCWFLRRNRNLSLLSITKYHLSLETQIR